MASFNWSLLPGQMLFSPGDANTIFMSMNGLDQGQLARYDISSNTITPLLYVYGAGGVRADPTTAGTVLVPGILRTDSHMHVWKSTDSGSTWLDLGGVLAFNVGLIGPDPSIAGRLYGNDDTGFAVSDDAGSTWTSRTQGIPLAQTFAVSIRPDNPLHIVTATQSRHFRQHRWRRDVERGLVTAAIHRHRVGAVAVGSHADLCGNVEPWCVSQHG